ncbi:MAG: ATP-dependent zinc metalloprotease FtsH [Chloroflexi bacterium]|nr:ATP-dependent zinc metalloprotease FtsH [Chloroflexota bacterium]
MSSRWMRNSFIYLLIIVAVVAIFFTLFSRPLGGSQEISINEVIALTARGDVAVIEIRGNTLDIVTVSGEALTSRKEDGSSIVEILERAGVDPLTSNVDIIVKGNSGLSSFVGILFNFLPLIFFGAVLMFMMRQAQGSSSQTFSFGRSRARVATGNSPSVSFDDVAGVDEAKEELQEVVEFLKFPERFLALGAKIPRGVLLIGPPGTGKTLMAKAVSGEAGVPFYSISGSEFVEMFVGVGASRVRDLFDQAKRNAPCIVFVDEIDAVGRHRGAGLGGGHDEREQTLNQILVEMDGFESGTNVIVLAATNRPDILDPALLRPGRFDRKVTLDNPDIRGRKQILEVHSKGKPLNADVDLDVVARQTVGFTGADLANLVNESAILAARRNQKEIHQPEFDESIDRVISGPQRKSRRISDREREMTAYHEAGHAVVAHALPEADPVVKVTIVARGQSGGFTKTIPTEDRTLVTRNQFEAKLAMAMGGRVAEVLVFDEITTGASNDLEQATNIAQTMVTRYGMSKRLGPRTFGKREEFVFLGREITDQRDYGDTVAQAIDDEVRRLLQTAYDTAKRILEEERARLDRVSKYLLEFETIDEEQIPEIFDPPPAGDTPPAPMPAD